MLNLISLDSLLTQIEGIFTHCLKTTLAIIKECPVTCCKDDKCALFSLHLAPLNLCLKVPPSTPTNCLQQFNYLVVAMLRIIILHYKTAVQCLNIYFLLQVSKFCLIKAFPTVYVGILAEWGIQDEQKNAFKIP